MTEAPGKHILDTKRLEVIERALMFMPYDRVRQRFRLSRSEMEDIAGPEEAEPERNATSGY